MANRPPRVPHSRGRVVPDDAGAGAAAEAADAAVADATAADEATSNATRADAEQAETTSLPVVGRGARNAADARDAYRRTGAAVRRTARRGADAVGQGAKRARDAVAGEIEADLRGERGPGGTRRPGRQEPEDRQRRLRERQALAGAIREQGGAGAPPSDAERPAAQAPVPARALSTRVIALALILIVSGFMLFPAVTTYVRQQGELHAAQAAIAREQATEDSLQAELKRWDDSEYVKQQARERIGQAEAGEKQYVVEGKPSAADEESSTVKPGEYRQGLPWGDGVWDSVLRSSTP